MTDKLAVAGDAFLLNSEIISRIEALTLSDFTTPSEILMTLLESAAKVKNMNSMDVSRSVDLFSNFY